MRRRRSEDLIVEHIASWYTQSYADVISKNTMIAAIGLLYAVSKGNDNINATVCLPGARHVRRVKIAVGPVPAYTLEHIFFSISLPTQFRRAIGRCESMQVGI